MNKCLYCGEDHRANYLCPAKLNAGITTRKLNTKLNKGVLLTKENLMKLYDYSNGELNTPLEWLTKEQFNKVIVAVFKED